MNFLKDSKVLEVFDVVFQMFRHAKIVLKILSKIFVFIFLINLSAIFRIF